MVRKIADRDRATARCDVPTRAGSGRAGRRPIPEALLHWCRSYRANGKNRSRVGAALIANAPRRLNNVVHFHHSPLWPLKESLDRIKLHLEDLFVRPEFRGKGIGKALLAHVAGIAVRENCYGVRWNVLDWNTPASDFYKSLGATFLNEWLTVRLDGEPLKRLAAESRAA